jgi:hypothetical protein
MIWNNLLVAISCQMREIKYLFLRAIEKEKNGIQTVIESIFNLTISWTFAGTRTFAERNTFEELLRSHIDGTVNIKQKCLVASVPPEGSLFDYEFEVKRHGGTWRLWSELIHEDLYYDDSFHNIRIVTKDTLRIDFWVDMLIKCGKPAILTGPETSGRTYMLRALPGRCDPSCYTVPINCREASALEVRVALQERLGRIDISTVVAENRTCLVLIDDVNLPTEAGSELVRQLVSTSTWWPATSIQNQIRPAHLQIVAAMSSSSTDSSLSARCFSKFFPLSLCTNSITLRSMFDRLLKVGIQAIELDSRLTDNLVAATVDLYNGCRELLYSQDGAGNSTIKTHYRLNIRQISRVVEGLVVGLAHTRQLVAEFGKDVGDQSRSKATMLRWQMVNPLLVFKWAHLRPVRVLWYYEVSRVFADGLDDQSLEIFENTLITVGKKHFDVVQKYCTQVHKDTLKAVNAANSSNTATWRTQRAKLGLDTQKKLLRNCECKTCYAKNCCDAAKTFLFGRFLDAERHACKFNQNGTEDLVRLVAPHTNAGTVIVTSYALSHIARICRVLERPRGHMLCIGPIGHGKTTLAHLSARVCQLGITELTIMSEENLRIVLKTLAYEAGLEDVPKLFILDGSWLCDSHVRELHNVLSATDIDMLYNRDERRNIATQIRTKRESVAAEEEDLPIISDAEALMLFAQRAADKLHLVICSTEVEMLANTNRSSVDAIRQLLSVDYFSAWPADAYAEIADSFSATAQLPEKIPDSAVRTVFESMDVDESGTIDRVEFHMAATKLGLVLTDAELDTAMQEMDEDGDGAIDFDEFLVYWKRSGSKLADAINVEVSRLLTLSKTDRDKLTVAMLTVHKLQCDHAKIQNSDDQELAIVPPCLFLFLQQTFYKVCKLWGPALFAELHRYDTATRTLQGFDDIINSMKRNLPQIEASVRHAERKLKVTRAELHKLQAIAKDCSDCMKASLDTLAPLQAEATGMANQLSERRGGTIVPALHKAMAVLDSISDAELAEIRSMHKPPDTVKLTIKLVATLMQVEHFKNAKRSDGDWSAGLKLLKDNNLKKTLLQLDKDKIPTEWVERARKVLGTPAFDYESVLAASKALAALYLWSAAVTEYAESLEHLRPLAAAFEIIALQLDEANLSSAAEHKKLRRAEKSVAAKQKDVDRANEELLDLEWQAKSARMVLDGSATEMIQTMHPELEEWRAKTNKLKEAAKCFLGDVLLAASSTVYLMEGGPMLRRDITRACAEAMRSVELSISTDYSLVRTLLPDLKSQRLVEIGLQFDAHMVESMMMAARSVAGTTVLLDPDGFAASWVDALGAAVVLSAGGCGEILQLADLEDGKEAATKEVHFATSSGRQLLVQGRFSGRLPQALQTVIARQPFMMEGMRDRMVVQLDGEVVPWDQRFRLHLLTTPHGAARPTDLPPQLRRLSAVVDCGATAIALRPGLLDAIFAAASGDTKAAMLAGRVDVAQKLERRCAKMRQQILAQLTANRGDLGSLDLQGSANARLVTGLAMAKASLAEKLKQLEGFQAAARELSRQRDQLLPVARSLAILVAAALALGRTMPDCRVAYGWLNASWAIAWVRERMPALATRVYDEHGAGRRTVRHTVAQDGEATELERNWPLRAATELAQGAAGAMFATIREALARRHVLPLALAFAAEAEADASAMVLGTADVRQTTVVQMLLQELGRLQVAEAEAMVAAEQAELSRQAESARLSWVRCAEEEAEEAKEAATEALVVVEDLCVSAGENAAATEAAAKAAARIAVTAAAESAAAIEGAAGEKAAVDTVAALVTAVEDAAAVAAAAAEAAVEKAAAQAAAQAEAVKAAERQAARDSAAEAELALVALNLQESKESPNEDVDYYEDESESESSSEEEIIVVMKSKAKKKSKKKNPEKKKKKKKKKSKHRSAVINAKESILTPARAAAVRAADKADTADAKAKLAEAAKAASEAAAKAAAHALVSVEATAATKVHAEAMFKAAVARLVDVEAEIVAKAKAEEAEAEKVAVLEMEFESAFATQAAAACAAQLKSAPALLAERSWEELLVSGLARSAPWTPLVLSGGRAVAQLLRLAASWQQLAADGDSAEPVEAAEPEIEVAAFEQPVETDVGEEQILAATDEVSVKTLSASVGCAAVVAAMEDVRQRRRGAVWLVLIGWEAAAEQGWLEQLGAATAALQLPERRAETHRGFRLWLVGIGIGSERVVQPLRMHTAIRLAPEPPPVEARDAAAECLHVRRHRCLLPQRGAIEDTLQLLGDARWR